MQPEEKRFLKSVWGPVRLWCPVDPGRVSGSCYFPVKDISIRNIFKKLAPLSVPN